ncbi:MAG TPA: dynamin family protein, partial [Bacillales bacterium]|nr:dynamin family protein [Bacillales bacterium]
AELDFSDYRRGIAEAFSAQDIKLESIFYTSLKDDEHQENEFADLQKYIRSLIENKDHLLLENTETAARQLIKEHLEYRAEKQSDERERLESSLDGLSEEERHNLLAEYRTLEQQLQEEKEKPKQFFEHAQAELNKVLDSSILMPYETRETGRSYVESLQPGFKVGLLGSKKKTEQEQQTRLDRFYKKVTETASALDWQVKEELIKEIEADGIQNEEFKKDIYDLQVTFDRQLLVDQIQSGATFNANYVLRYTEKVSEAIQQCYRRAAIQKLEDARMLLEKDASDTIEKINVRLTELDEKIAVLKELQEMDDTEEKERQRLEEILSGQIDTEELEAALSTLPEQEKRPVVKKMSSAQPKKTAKKTQASQKTDQVEELESAGTGDFQQRLRKTAKQLKATSEQIASIKGFRTSAQEMLERAKRLEENRFTVALFGAFSAGKSSFANALIGENVLPVSPNPTTAAINKISPADDEHPHKTACVLLKKEQEILADVREALKPFGETLDQLDELPDLLEKLDAENAQISFLKAVAQGMNGFGKQLGSQQLVDIENFYEIVSNEAKAVFVESIELFYDCPLTEQGITLVDTPGADSINARHTGVAFDYIKNADAILFVTYYNHAFSRADREFLIQLGRVKDSFAMDKMFFIVNAADLAASEDELNTVVDYVGENLISYGIRKPRIYPISSKQALADKQANGNNETSGMAQFEKEFSRFTMEELTNIAVEAARSNVNRAIRTLDSYIASAREDKNVRLQKQETALQKKNEIETLIHDTAAVTEKRALEQEISQLVYYIQQRVFLRYLD